MTRLHLNVVALVSYVAGGGLAGAFALGAQIWPGHGSQILGAAAALVAIAGAMRTLITPPPSKTVSVEDLATREPVSVPVAAPK